MSNLFTQDFRTTPYWWDHVPRPTLPDTPLPKKVDVAVYEFLKAEIEGSFESGEVIFDLAAGGVDYSATGGKVDDIKDQLDELKQQIIDGEITVPTTP